MQNIFLRSLSSAFRGGYVAMTTGALRYTGLVGYYWGLSAYPSELYAYALNFDNADVDPSGISDRWYGFAVQHNILRELRRLIGKNTKAQGKLIAINDKFITSDGKLFLDLKIDKITGVDLCKQKITRFLILKVKFHRIDVRFCEVEVRFCRVDAS